MQHALSMSDCPTALVAATFKALAHPVRLRILEALRHGPCHISQLIVRVHEHQANVSKHVGILARVGFIQRTRRGNRIVCSADTVTLHRLWKISGLTDAMDRLNDALYGFCPEI
jgi:DNA-binding transcriptional ArsR family regulator